MYICLCHAITDHDIRQAAADGVGTFAELQARTGCSDCCGSCEAEARHALATATGTMAFDLPVIAIAA